LEDSGGRPKAVDATHGRVSLKKMKINESKSAFIFFLPFISFSESGLFKGLQLKKSKKIPAAKLASQVAQNAPSPTPSPACALISTAAHLPGV
jgi:hypothetical protein